MFALSEVATFALLACYAAQNTIKYDSLTQHFNISHPMLHVWVQRTTSSHYFTTI